MRRARSGSSKPRGLRVGIDTGGTFTDFHVIGRGVDLIFKVPSTPRDPAAAVLEGLRRIRAGLAAPEGARARAGRLRARGEMSVVHGTTVGTNALLTRRVARTAFVTTAGFEDVLE